MLIKKVRTTKNIYIVETKYNLVTANHYSVCNCNKTGTCRFKGGKVIEKLKQYLNENN